MNYATKNVLFYATTLIGCSLIASNEYYAATIHSNEHYVVTMGSNDTLKITLNGKLDVKSDNRYSISAWELQNLLDQPSIKRCSTEEHYDIRLGKMRFPLLKTLTSMLSASPMVWPLEQEYLFEVCDTKQLKPVRLKFICKKRHYAGKNDLCYWKSNKKVVYVNIVFSATEKKKEEHSLLIS
jgi:hypothetical protein